MKRKDTEKETYRAESGKEETTSDQINWVRSPSSRGKDRLEF